MVSPKYGDDLEKFQNDVLKADIIDYENGGKKSFIVCRKCKLVYWSVPSTYSDRKNKCCEDGKKSNAKPILEYKISNDMKVYNINTMKVCKSVLDDEAMINNKKKSTKIYKIIEVDEEFDISTSVINNISNITHNPIIMSSSNHIDNSIINDIIQIKNDIIEIKNFMKTLTDIFKIKDICTITEVKEEIVEDIPIKGGFKDITKEEIIIEELVDEEISESIEIGDRQVLFESGEDAIRNSQVDFEKVKKNITNICLQKGGICLNINQYKYHQTKLTFKCDTCDKEWQATHNNIIHHNSWCPDCGTNKTSERRCRAVLQYLFLDQNFPSKRPEFLKYDNNFNLELDCYNKEINLALEMNGIQHYKMDPFFHRPNKIDNLSKEELKEICLKNFENQQKRDKFKLDKCNELGIHLIIISYIDVKKGFAYIKDKIYKRCKELNLSCISLGDDDEWLNSNTIGLNLDKLSVERIKRIEEYIKTDAIGYKIKDLEVIIDDYRDSFTLICPLEHEYNTTIDNFINGGKRCGKCSPTNPNTIEGFKEEVEFRYPDTLVTIIYDKNGKSDQYVNTTTGVIFRCLACNIELDKNIDSIRKTSNLGKKLHSKPIKCKGRITSDADIKIWECGKNLTNEKAFK